MSVFHLPRDGRRFNADRRDHQRDQRRARRAARTRPVLGDVELELIEEAPAERVPWHLREHPAPEPLPGREQLVGAARYLAARARAHARSSPAAGWRLAGWTAVGAGRAWAVWWHLATSPEHRALRKAAAGAQDHHRHLGHLSASRRDTAMAAAVAVVVVGAPVAVLAASRVLSAALAVAAAGVLALVGRQPEQRLAVPRPDGRAPAPDTILKAFEDSGFKGCATVGSPSVEGRGLTRRSRVIVDVVPATAAEVIRAREKLAANLRRDLPCVHLSRGAHAGQVILTQLERDPMAGPPVPSPLLKAASWSLWDPIPWGFDIRGTTVLLPLLWTSLLVGAKPRMGKTFSIRTLVLAACLDVHARVYLWDGKGGGDYRAFRPACVVWGQGHAARKGQPKACLKMLQQVSDLVGERNERIDRLPTHLRPEGKLTREVAEDPEYDLPLILVVVDEVQRLVADRDHGAAIRDELIALAQNAPSCGVILVVGAQRPTQTTGQGSLGDLPPATGSRAAFKTMDAGESNVILGAGHAGAGYDSSVFPDEYEGVCLLRSGADVVEGPKGVQQVKTFFADDTQLETKMAAVIEARAAAGLLPRPAAVGTVVLEKDGPGAARARLVDVFEPGEDRVRLADLAGRLGVEPRAARQVVAEAGGRVKTIRLGSETAEGVDRADFS